MNRIQLEALLQDGKATNGGAMDFMIQVPPAEVGASLQILAHFKANGLITSYERCPSPPHEEGCIDIMGYTG